MAIHYKHIKGMNALQTYCTLRWPVAAYEDTSSLDGSTYNPRVLIGTADVGTDDATDVSTSTSGYLGYMITSHATDQSIDQEFSFTNILNIVSSSTSDTSPLNFYLDDDCMAYTIPYMEDNDVGMLYTVLDGAVGYAFKASVDDEVEDILVLWDSSATESLPRVDVCGDLTVENDVTADGDIVSSNKVEGLYFNSTSDRRAKKNIKPFTFNALDFVIDTPIYTYQYNNADQNSFSVGIMAQDAALVDMDRFSLVDNINATGEKNDYMKVKESKIPFINMQAIKQQQELIETLWAEIRSLKQEIQTLKKDQH